MLVRLDAKGLNLVEKRMNHVAWLISIRLRHVVAGLSSDVYPLNVDTVNVNTAAFLVQ